MKRTVYSIAITFILILSVTSCTAQKSGSSVTAGTPVLSVDSAANTSTPEKKLEIDIQSPMTLSNTMCTFNGQSAYLRLKMVKGRYYEDWNPGALMGTIWEGSFVIDLTDEYGKIITETDISKMFTETLTFKTSFNLEFDDYNNDGDLDFTIGQYGSSNGNVYKIFTLRKDGSIEELPVKDHPNLFISDSAGYYSTKLKKMDKESFKIGYYDNSKGTFRDTYHWENGQFVRVQSINAGDDEADVRDKDAEPEELPNGFEISSVTVNGKAVPASLLVVNEFGFNLNTFCKEVYPDLKLQVLDKSEIKGAYNDTVPTKFTITYNQKTLRFNGVAYKSSVNGELVAEYIAGDFGEVRARYKRGIYLVSKESVASFLDVMGIGYTFMKDNSIDIQQ